MSNTTVQLITSDGKKIIGDSSLINASKFIQDMIHDMNSDASVPTIEIPLVNINSVILNKVVEFCIHHRDDPPFTAETLNKFRQQANMTDHWDEQFCKVDQKTLFDLMTAANFLNVQTLLEVTCKAVANLIRGKTPQEIRATFNIEPDLTPEEEEAIMQENKWCMDD
jgi:S-phase kinase-associated protein 1